MNDDHDRTGAFGRNADRASDGAPPRTGPAPARPKFEALKAQAKKGLK